MPIVYIVVVSGRKHIIRPIAPDLYGIRFFVSIEDRAAVIPRVQKIAAGNEKIL